MKLKNASHGPFTKLDFHFTPFYVQNKVFSHFWQIILDI